MILLILILVVGVNSFSIKDKYCGNDNCFKILGLKEDATKDEIKQQFRSLSKVNHPDKAKQRGEDTTILYRQIVHAYEIISNDETKSSYLDFLNNPNKNEMFHYYRYYQAEYNTIMPQENPFLVIIIASICLTTIQYTARYGMYQSAVNQASNTSYFKRLLNDRFNDQASQAESKDKDEIKKQMLLEIKIKGSYSKPQLKDMWCMAIILFFWERLVFDLYFCLKWKYYYRDPQRTISQHDSLTKTRKVLDISKSKWEDMEIEQRFQLECKQLWIQENLIEYQREEKEKYQEYVSQHMNKFKQMKRWNKKQN